MKEIPKLEEKLSFLEELILLILYLSKEEILSYDLKLNDIIFLISQEIDELKNIDFKPTIYGIYSEKIKKTIEELVNKDYIKIIDDRLILTDEGKNIAEDILNNLDKKNLDVIKENIEFFEGLTYEEILSFLYYKFPEYFEKIRKLQSIENNRLEIAIELYKKEKISIEAASEIAGISLYKFIEILKSRKLI
ncbi:MAG: UPF0175 family protein [Nanopusillaceae archaeon]